MISGPPLDREAVGALKHRLRNDPADEEARADIVGVYRSLGHLDQAGRYAIGMEEGVPREELRAYAGLVRTLGADEKRVRQLSLVPADRELPGEIRKAIEAGPLVDDWRPWGVVVAIAWAAVGVVAIMTISVGYAFTMAGAADARSIARAWTFVTGCVLAVALVLTTLWCASSSKWRAAAVWMSITTIYGALFVLGSVLHVQ